MCVMYSVIVTVLFYSHVTFGDSRDNVEKPNIVIILADDLGWNDVGFHGSNHIPTPNIDALGYNGVIFDKYYTQHACTPSRAALLTGKYPIKSGFQGTPIRGGENRTLPHSMPTLPAKLRDLGYSTHLVGKWHLGYGYKNATPLAHGYDTFYGYYNGYIGYFDDAISQAPLKSGIDFHRNFEPIVTEQGKYVTDLLTTEAESIISSRNGSEPFFMLLSHLAPHTGKTIAPGITVLEVADIDEVNRKYSYIEDPNRRLLADVVERLDSSIGTIMKALSDKNLLENTIVIFMSDNGGQTYGMHENFASNWPLRGMKFTLFEGGVKVPAVIYSSKIKNKGSINRNLFHITDWYPTLYSAAGGNPADLGAIDGVDQWESIINDEYSNRRKEVLLNIDEVLNFSGIVGFNGQFKLLNNSYENNVYDNSTGAAGRSLFPLYNIKKVMESETNRAIQKVAHTIRLTVIAIRYLRKQVTMRNCRPVKPAKVCTGKCLFNLREDPCETNDISALHPEIVENLWGRIKEFELQLVPQQNSFVDSRADPSYCKDTWFSWLEPDNTGCWYNSDHTQTI